MPRKARRSGSSSRGRPSRDVSLDAVYLESLGESVSVDDREDPVPDGSGPVRKTFGDAWIVLEISEDGQQASLRELSFGGDASLGRKDVRSALTELFGLVFGLRSSLVDRLADQARAAPSRTIRGKFAVAVGDAPEPGADGRVVWTCLREESVSAFSCQDLTEALARSQVQEVIAQSFKACLVIPGEELAKLIPPTDGKAGRDVLGRRRHLPGDAVTLELGDGVKQVGGRYLADTYGYLCVSGSRISVRSPVWISSERMAAHFIYFPGIQPWRNPSVEWLLNALERSDVRHGILDAALESLASTTVLARDPAHLVLARGTPPVPGVDAHIDYAFNPAQMAGRILEDGSIDLRERNSAVSVRADQLLGTVVAATSGQPGMDVLGTELATRDGDDQEFEAGDNVRGENREGSTVFVAEVDGVVTLQGGRLGVNPILLIQGDVDYETGNVDVAKDVHISGCVRSGFRVSAGGNITVGDLVEDGARLHAKGDVIAAKGIVGESTQVVALGNVQTKFVQNSSLMVKGDLTVGSYIFNARVRAGGRIMVHSAGSRGGSIVGGEVFASRDIEVRSIGSPTTSHTVVGIGPAPEAAARLAKIRKIIDFCDANSLRMLRTLGLQTVDGAQIKRIISRTRSPRKQQIIDLVKKLSELTRTRERSLGQQRELEAQIAVALEGARIQVTETAFANSTIHMGADARTLTEDLHGQVFFKEDDGIGHRPAGVEPAASEAG